jgi:hypothetical protein
MFVAAPSRSGAAGRAPSGRTRPSVTGRSPAGRDEVCPGALSRHARLAVSVDQGLRDVAEMQKHVNLRYEDFQRPVASEDVGAADDAEQGDTNTD